MDREALINQLFETMEVAKRSMHGRMQQLVANQRLSRTELELLLTIRHHQPVSAKQLAQLLHISPGAVSQLMDSLSTDQLVERTIDPADRRRQTLRVSPQGAELLKEAEKRRYAFMKDLMETMTDEELQVWLRVQQKLIDRFTNQPDKSTKGAN